MKSRFYLLLVAVAALFFAVGQVSAGKGRGLVPQTQKNLSTAMHGEAFAYAKYSLHAKQAPQNGNAELANLFEEAADTERFEHFADEAQLAGLVGSDAENLKDAIQGESYEIDTMYREFAKVADAAGDDVAAERFEEIRQDETKHRDAFKAALIKVESKTTAAR